MIQKPISGEYSLYFHIPFCQKKCPYCDFYVLPNQEPLKAAWLEGILLELNRVLHHLPKGALKSIYFGGGTPSLIGPKRLEQVLAPLQSRISSETEITLEVNPESAEEISDYKKLGVNRVSLGVQSLNDPELTILGRGHAKTTATGALHKIVQSGIDNISIDLMYDLPHQTLESFTKTVQEALSLPITHLSLYNLTFEPKTPFFRKRKELEIHLPTSQQSVEMFLMAKDLLEQSGFLHYEISAFAKKGCYSRHNTGYWTYRTFWGLGPSAFSFVDGARFQNPLDQKKWLQCLQQGNHPKAFYEKLDPEHLRLEELAISLRLLQGIQKTDFALLHLQKLIEDGLIEESPERIRLTKKGILFYDTVAETVLSGI